MTETGGQSPIRPRAVLIAGPTASGKSALALELAERTGGLVINADSMQVYADLAVLSARPTRQEEARAPHRLYGHVDGAADYSVAHWVEDARAVLAQAERERRLPILIGGTGLYFKALVQGLSPMPPVPDAVKAVVRGRGEDAEALHARLSRIDPLTAARLRPSDTQRLTRAVEVFEATGRPLALWQDEATSPPLLRPGEVFGVFLATDRTELRARIAARFRQMMEAGALEEVRRLVARGLPADRTILKAHGVPWLARHLAGEVTREAAIEGGIADTRRYAKRQETWFRHQIEGFAWLTPPEAARAFAERVVG
ncbi:tRNA (adenosine(37)-N6)-dimethylallyltransferase MiaA [Ancylobacter sp. Lp-2]|uniref:tRNA (adenosine(37)-N6)-dimethylallyltransferase MiaA n=1 Tax=Ancylobacter sp. Lp-2 TaxID=2881339 RepID=UPI001E475F66|nr:tRNA (adenosine(37)-N6)-dimethylallyltransferase MiaA [Ancylobacter sp. Lp-2]